MLQGSPSKLTRSGKWGIRIVLEVGTPRPSSGDEVTVRSRAGKEWDDKIGEIVWSGETDDGDLIYLCTSKNEEDKSGGAKSERGIAQLPPNWQELFKQMADHMDDGNLTAFAEVLRFVADGPPDQLKSQERPPKKAPAQPPVDDPDEMPF